MSYFCKICDYKSKYKSEWSLHNYSIEHIKKCNNIIITNKFICEACDYKCSKKYNLDRHILSAKHFQVTQNEHSINSTAYSCEHCGQNYESRNGLWKHKKKCTLKIKEKNTSNIASSEVNVLSKLVLELVKSNGDLQKQMLEVLAMGNDEDSKANKIKAKEILIDTSEN